MLSDDFRGRGQLVRLPAADNRLWPSTGIAATAVASTKTPPRTENSTHIADPLLSIWEGRSTRRAAERKGQRRDFVGSDIPYNER